MMDRYVILAVEYERGATDEERSLRWLAPELADAGLSLTEDTRRVREWVGAIDGDTHARLAERLGLGDRADQPGVGVLTEYGQLPCLTYTWDGMQCEGAGSSPIVWISVKLSDPIEAELVAYGWCG